MVIACILLYTGMLDESCPDSKGKGQWKLLAWDPFKPHSVCVSQWLEWLRSVSFCYKKTVILYIFPFRYLIGFFVIVNNVCVFLKIFLLFEHDISMNICIDLKAIP